MKQLGERDDHQNIQQFWSYLTRNNITISVTTYVLL